MAQEVISQVRRLLSTGAATVASLMGIFQSDSRRHWGQPGIVLERFRPAPWCRGEPLGYCMNPWQSFLQAFASTSKALSTTHALTCENHVDLKA
jgi:hypothetical protein